MAELDDHAAVSGVAVLHAATESFRRLSPNGDGAGRAREHHAGRRRQLWRRGRTVPSGIQAPVAVVASDGGTFLVGDWMTGAVYRVTLDSGGAVFAGS
ncbi:hypothetical protein [Candidatus Amarobacter glycogenicus]|uniref:hypothetical protein n=1 Tax=Candidatus Amarobacter glycogenicus TaxID=3140699 RepID=UPI002A16164B|nr:hypothetical protein [Dehalococcoidia bacterium]